MPSLEKVNVGLSFHTGMGLGEIMEKGWESQTQTGPQVKEASQNNNCSRASACLGASQWTSTVHKALERKAEVNDLAVVS